MIFKAPWMLLLLLLLPFLWKLALRARRKQSETAQKLRGQARHAGRPDRRDLLRLASLSALLIALAQPVWNPRSSPLAMQGRDLAIALDISRSMLADDVFPSRLDVAKISVFEALDALRGQRIGLITFAGAASVRVPLTLDQHFVRYMLKRAVPSDADVGSTSLQAAIEKAVDVVLPGSKPGEQDLIIFTDGEDHISDIEKTTEELRACGARVLIVGLGDPLAGARVPAVEPENEWMQYEGQDVISRLDEDTLIRLSAESPNVTYYPAHTRPFDLVTLYQKMIADTEGLPISDETQVIYTEGYPFFIALCVLLWFFPLNKTFFPSLAAWLLVGCSPVSPSPDSIYTEHVEQGRTFWTEAQISVESDPQTARGLLLDARSSFLLAAMMQPGDEPAAEQIAGVSAQLRAVEQQIQDQEEAENDLRQALQAAIEQLTRLTRREEALSRISRDLLRKRPPARPEERAAAAPSAREEQVAVGEGTEAVLATVTEVQSVVQNMLATAYGEGKTPQPTEYDQALAELISARSSQRSAIDHLTPDAVQWPPANSAFHSAARQMQEALRLLSDQNQGQGQDAQDSEDSSEEGDMDWDGEEDWEGSESDRAGDLSMPMTSGAFNTALDNPSLPAPNFTAEEIMMEEAANLEQRAQQQSGRAGAKVEKNW